MLLATLLSTGTIFAYGQTGTGKTYTMEGMCSGCRLRGMTGCNLCATGVRSDPELRGVIPNAFDHIFTHIQRTENEQFLVRASYLEIYQVCVCMKRVPHRVWL